MVPVIYYIVFSASAAAYLVGALCAVGYVLQERFCSPLLAQRAALIGLIVHTGLLGWFAISEGSIPVGNLFQTMVLFLWCVALVLVFVDRIYNVPALAAFLLPLMVALSAGAIALAANREQELPAGLAKFWLVSHVAPILLGYASFAGGFVLSLMYLVQQRQLKGKHFGPVAQRLPSLEMLEKLSARCTTFGFPLLTLGLVLGIIWLRVSPQALGDAGALSDWKVMLGLAVWLVYAVLLHARLAVKAHGKTIAYMTIGGFLLVVLTFFGAFAFGETHAFTPDDARAPSAAQ